MRMRARLVLLVVAVAGISVATAQPASAQLGSCTLKLHGTRYGVFFQSSASPCKLASTVARHALLNRWAEWGHKDLNNARKNPRPIRIGKTVFRCVDRPRLGTYAMERCAPRGHQEQWVQVWAPGQSCGQAPIRSDDKAMRWQTVCG